MNLPGSRNNTYTGATPVAGADLNAIQDCIIGGKHGLVTKTISPLGFQGVNAAGVQPSYGSGGTPQFTFVGASGQSTFYLPLDFIVGDRILAIRMNVKDPTGGGGSSDQMIGSLYVNTTFEVSTNVSAGTGAIQTLTTSAMTPVVVGSSEALCLTVATGAGGTSGLTYFVNWIEIDFDHP